MKSQKRMKILFVANLDLTYVRTDLKLLKKHFKVRVVDLSRVKNLPSALKFLFELLKGVLWSQITFTWFAGVHSFPVVLLSKIFRKKSIVVTGGYDVADVPEIDYGAMRDSRKARLIKFSLRNADKILAISEFIKKEILRWVNREVDVIFEGIDCDKFRPSGHKENLVITVGRINKLTLKRKGIESFVKSAKYIPDTPFVVVGGSSDKSMDYLKSIATENVSFAGFVPEEELIKWYRRAKVYCQLSLHEGFGTSIGEAMACGCIPVVTDKGAIPEVVGDTGFYVPYNDPEKIAEGIKKALGSEKGKEARERALALFSEEKRGEKLKEVIESL